MSEEGFGFSGADPSDDATDRLMHTLVWFQDLGEKRPQGYNRVVDILV
ncbi:MAG: hypothetical protein MJA27_28210 [Pseudanabaenales cyanobacterium]|nr:hypothetical protein [Pseudanabaenales cyanobacterium]